MKRTDLDPLQLVVDPYQGLLSQNSSGFYGISPLYIIPINPRVGAKLTYKIHARKVEPLTFSLTYGAGFPELDFLTLQRSVLFILKRSKKCTK
jgi:hypothetical protein